MKKIFLSICTGLLLITAQAADPSPISEKAIKSFNESFKNAANISWLADKSTYEVYFEQNEIKSRIKYSEDGTMLQTMRYYDGSKLPLMVSAKLAKKYAGKKVFGITEVSDMQTISYHIILEDEKNWIHVTGDIFGNLFVDKKLRKA